jgi:hypothetical protein
VPAQLDRLPPGAQFQIYSGVFIEESLRNPDHRRCRRRNTQVAQEHRSDPFVDQDSPMLRVIEELNHIVMAVSRFDQMCLSPSPHLADQAACVDRH